MNDIHPQLRKAQAEAATSLLLEVQQECIAQRKRADRAYAALRAILAEPHGCSLCDSGVPRNPAKGHQPDCPYEMARAVLAEAGEGNTND